MINWVSGRSQPH